MTRARLSALDVLKALPRTNCGKCDLPTCFAFANQVALERRPMSACPELTAQDRASLRDMISTPENDADQQVLDDLTRRVREVPFDSVAAVVGAELLKDGSLLFRCLGRPFIVEATGRLRSRCHANFWVLVPLLDTIACAAERLSSRLARADDRVGGWVKFDELGHAMSSTDFFSQSCEGPLRQLADEDLALFADMVDVFGGEQIDHGFGAELSMVVYPLPNLPILICYWAAEGPFGSKLSLYVDRSTDEQLSVEGVYVLVTGLVTMFKKVFARHAVGGEGRP